MLGIAEKIVSWLYAYFQKRRSIAGELEGLKRGLLMTMVSNQLDGPLNGLRDFFLRNPRLLEHAENQRFVTQWLMDQYRQAWGSVPGMWPKERWDQLRSDVVSLRAA